MKVCILRHHTPEYPQSKNIKTRTENDGEYRFKNRNQLDWDGILWVIVVDMMAFPLGIIYRLL